MEYTLWNGRQQVMQAPVRLHRDVDLPLSIRGMRRDEGGIV